MLVLIPKTVNKQPFTLKALADLVKEPKIGFRHIWESILKEHGETPIKESHWVLMTKDVIPESRAKSYAEQQKSCRRQSKLSSTNTIRSSHLYSNGIYKYRDSPL